MLAYEAIDQIFTNPNEVKNYVYLKYTLGPLFQDGWFEGANPHLLCVFLSNYAYLRNNAYPNTNVYSLELHDDFCKITQNLFEKSS
jgi:hypothetical protein